MSNRVNNDAAQIKKQIRHVESLMEEAMTECAKLKLAMLNARANPDVSLGRGHATFLHLNRAEERLSGSFGDILKVHDGLSAIAVETAGVDEGMPTVREPMGQMPEVFEQA